MALEYKTSSLFASFEGIDFSGKSTVATMIANDLKEKGLNVEITRDPPYGLDPWSMLQEKVGITDKLDPVSEALLFLTARRDNYARVIYPKLNEGGIVIADRFLDSWFAYQSIRLAPYFGNEDSALDFLLGINQRFVSQHLLAFPDVTILVDNDAHTTFQRKHLRAEDSKYEVLDTQVKVADQYRRLISSFPERIKVVDARGKTLFDVYEESRKIIFDRITNLYDAFT